VYGAILCRRWAAVEQLASGADGSTDDEATEPRSSGNEEFDVEMGSLTG
jgi:hypothetical protein